MPIFWQQFYRRQILLLLSCGALFALTFHFTSLDLLLADAWYDPAAQAWPLRKAWWAATFVHHWLKIALIVAGLVCIATAWKRRSTADARQWRLVAASALVVPLVISLCKRASTMHCPWDVDRFGGIAPYFDLLSAAPAHLVDMGRCFPAGFVSSGSWLLAFALLRYPQQKRTSWRYGLAALTFCFALGVVQQMRGAHFLSHTLWSLWLSWALILALHAALGIWRAPVVATPP